MAATVRRPSIDSVIAVNSGRCHRVAHSQQYNFDLETDFTRSLPHFTEPVMSPICPEILIMKPSRPSVGSVRFDATKPVLSRRIVPIDRDCPVYSEVESASVHNAATCTTILARACSLCHHAMPHWATYIRAYALKAVS